MLLERSAEREQTLAEASERHLMRLGFDLHDGPLQDLAALEHGRPGCARGDHASGSRCGRAASSADASKTCTHRSGRSSSRFESWRASLQPVSILERPLAEVLRREVDKFESRGHPRVTLELGGDLDRLTDYAADHDLPDRAGGPLERPRSQRGDRRSASRSTAAQGIVQVQIEDNGKGFHVEPTMIRAAKNGRLGLVGHRRARPPARRSVRHPQPDRRTDDAQRRPASLASAARRVQPQLSDSSSTRNAAARSSAAASRPQARRGVGR